MRKRKPIKMKAPVKVQRGGHHRGNRRIVTRDPLSVRIGRPWKVVGKVFTLLWTRLVGVVSTWPVARWRRRTMRVSMKWVGMVWLGLKRVGHFVRTRPWDRWGRQAMMGMARFRSVICEGTLRLFRWRRRLFAADLWRCGRHAAAQWWALARTGEKGRLGQFFNPSRVRIEEPTRFELHFLAITATMLLGTITIGTLVTLPL